MTAATGWPHRVALLVALLTWILVGCSPASVTDAPVQPDPVVDGYAIGPERAAFNSNMWHHLEVAARETWRRDHPHHPSGYYLHHAGVLADGTIQAGSDELFTFLMVFDVPGEGQHAMVLRCSPLVVVDLGDCS